MTSGCKLTASQSLPFGATCIDDFLELVNNSKLCVMSNMLIVI